MIFLIASNILAVIVILMIARKAIKYRQNSMAFQRLIDRVNIACFRYRYKDGVILRTNRGLVDILELDIAPREAVGRSLNELMIYVDGEDIVKEQVRIMGNLRNYEYHIKTLRGKDKWVLHDSYMVRDPYTGEECVEAIIQDITEERVSYDMMKQSQERYEKLFSNSGDMVIIFKVNGSAIEEVNPVTELVTGFSSAELMGKPFDALFHPLSRMKIEEAREDLLFKGGSQIEAVVVSRNGNYKNVFLTMSVVELQDERRVMVLAKDISELKKDMEEQKRRKAELEDFWKAAVEREERIKDLRHEIEEIRGKVKADEK
ncbi:MAG: PAS domain S-box protein [Candidatus Omnitrophica bacterium]|nr:PAS domain S-box protein [Candidatus Omnitrophota bacterium]